MNNPITKEQQRNLSKLAAIGKAATALADAAVLNDVSPDDLIDLVAALANKKIKDSQSHPMASYFVG